MNIPVLIAAIFSGVAFIIHTIVGDRELKVLMPDGDTAKLEKWTMSRCGWHWISFDLLATSTLLLIMVFSNFFAYEIFLLNLLGFYYLGYGTVWLLTIFISRRFPQNYLRLGQWILLYSIGGLILWGANG